MRKLYSILIFLFSVGYLSGIVCAETDNSVPDSENTVRPILTDDLPMVSEEMVKVLIDNLDNFFPISSQRQIFVNPEEALYSDVGKETVVRMGTEMGKRNILIFANADSVRDYSGFTKIDDAYPTDFQMTMDVTVEDVFPGSEGGCFVGFTNYGISAFSGETGALMVQLYSDGKNAGLFVKRSGAPSGEHVVISSNVRKTVRLSILHLTEHTYMFINGNYAGQFHDGKSGPFQLIYGATVFANGDTANCTFDNLAVRKAYN